MQIVIDIDEDTYRYMQSRFKYQNKDDKVLSTFEKAGVAIKNGIVLQKGHGRLIDADNLIDVISDNHINGYEGIMNNDYNDDYTDGLHCALCDIDDADVIIPAEKDGD